MGGLSLREYTAIHTLQPSSGLEWLDDMIRARMRDEMAGRALIALSEIIKDAKIGENDAARYAFLYADAMMKQREER